MLVTILIESPSIFLKSLIFDLITEYLGCVMMMNGLFISSCIVLMAKMKGAHLFFQLPVELLKLKIEFVVLINLSCTLITEKTFVLYDSI